MTKLSLAFLPFAAFSAVATAPVPATSRVAVPLAPCGSGPGIDCVVDGDTFWLRGEKIRIADINSPETSGAACPHEAELGRAAEVRMIALLNAGPFELQPWRDGRDRDRYGRLLRTVNRNGESLGQVLVREGLAEAWTGKRRSWC